MSMPTATDLDATHRAMLDAFPPLPREGKRAGLALYRLLMEAGPVRAARLASAMDLSVRQTDELLNEPGMRCQLLFDAAERITGFGGLTVNPTEHRVTVDGRTTFTWCAWDTFFIPGLLGAAEARAASTCPATGVLLELVITPEGVSCSASTEPVLSFTLPDARHCAESTERSIACFCSQVRLISSLEAGRTWSHQRAGVFLLSLAEAVELGRRYNAARFGIRWEPASQLATPVEASGG